MNLPKISPPYKSNSNQWYTKALFWDLVVVLREVDRTIHPVFTLHDDKEGYINARKAFVELDDPTGYKWAMKYLGDWSHWLALEKCKWFRDALAIWREELRMKQKAEAIESIRVIAASDDKQALVAARYIAEQGWEKRPSTRGRPSKEELAGELKRNVDILAEEEEDAKRIGLVK